MPPPKVLGIVTMSIAEPDPEGRKALLKLVREKSAQIAADNEAAKAERNARRWREQRDPIEYEKQKEKQREEYANLIAAEEGREVRAYTKVPGKTRAEHAENAKARHAEKQRARWGNVTQAEKDAKADKVWLGRMRKKGWTDEQLAQGLAKRATDRLYRKPEPVPYEENPNFGLF